MDCTDFKNDEAFVKAIRARGRVADRALGCLYVRYKPDAYRILASRVNYNSRQRDELNDLLQDAFIIMKEKIQGDGYNDGSLIHFWIGIARGLLRNKVKKDARTDLVDDTLTFDKVDGDSPERAMMLNERSELLHNLLERLGPKCRDVLLLWARGYSMREIKTELGLSSEAMARKTKFGCKKKLQSLLENVSIDF